MQMTTTELFAKSARQAKLLVWARGTILRLRRELRQSKAAFSAAAPRKALPIDEEGPFREPPELDVEFVDDAGNPVGDATCLLQVRIHELGIVLRGIIKFSVARRTKIGGYRVWVGDDKVETTVDGPTLQAGDTYMLTFTIPIRLSGGIDHRDRRPAPEPSPPPPVTAKMD